MIILRKLKWSNVFSYGDDNEIDFTKDKVVQLIGTNGRGKSSIAWIIEEVLYNKNSRNRKKEFIVNWNRSNKPYTIEIQFTIDTDDYIVKVKRASTLSVSLIKNNEDISSHTATNTFKQIESILGYPFKTFCQIVFQTHSSSLEFLTSPDTARKKFLIDLINLTKYTDLGDIFKKEQADALKELSYINGRISTIQDWIDRNNKLGRDKKGLLDEIELDTSLSLKRDELKVKLASVDSNNSKVTKNRVYKQSIANIDISVIPKKPDKDIQLLKTEKAILQKIIKDSQSITSRLSQLDRTCPTCLQEISESIKSKLLQEEEIKCSQAKRSWSNLDVDISELQNAIDVWNRFNANKAELEKLHCLIDDSVPDIFLEKDSIEEELKLIEKQISNTVSALAVIKKHNEEARIHNNKVDLIEEQLQEYSIELQECTLKHKEISEKHANISILVKAFSTTGLVAYKLESITNSLQEIVNEYLVALSDGQFQILFSLSGNDKLDITISNNGVDADISSLSAGETTRVNISVLLGIRKLMQQISGNSINLLFLDESISTLDAYGKDKLVEVLLAEEGINTVIVSHEYQHPLIPNIQVLKDDLFSYLIRD